MGTTKKEQSFEEALASLDQIVNELEQGDVPLEQALSSFKKGIELSQYCQKKLANAEQVLTKIMDEEGNEVVFEKKELTDDN